MRYILSIIFLLSFLNMFAQELSKTVNTINASGRVNIRLVGGEEGKVVLPDGYTDVLTVEVKDSILQIKSSALRVATLPEVKVPATYLKYLDVGLNTKVYNKGGLEQIELIEASAGASVDLLLSTDSIEAKVNKGAYLNIGGKANYLKFKATSKSDFRAIELKCKQIEGIVSASTAEVFADSSNIVLEAKLKGSILYLGKPASKKEKKSSGGKIERLP